jgi:hypothetical protein
MLGMSSKGKNPSFLTSLLIKCYLHLGLFVGIGLSFQVPPLNLVKTEVVIEFFNRILNGQRRFFSSRVT